MRPATAALALSAALLTGCVDGEDDAALTTPTPTPTAVTPTTTAPEPNATATGTTTPSQQWPTCVSTRASLRVSYPAGWTARDYPDGGCAYFDPQPFEVQRGTEAPDVAVRLDVESVPYDRVKRAYLDGEVISQREVQVAGYPGVRVEDRDTGGPLGPKGRRLTYLADLGNDTTLVLTTNETDARDPAAAREVVDEMAERLQRTA